MTRFVRALLVVLAWVVSSPLVRPATAQDVSAPADMPVLSTVRSFALRPAQGVPSSSRDGFSRPPAAPTAETTFKDALLAEIRKSKAVFYNTVVAQAQKIEMADDRLTFVFSPAQRTLKDVFEQNRPWLETLAQQLAGKKIVVAGVQRDAPAGAQAAPAPPAADKKSALREQALADSSVQALLEMFPAEIRDVEEM